MKLKYRLSLGFICTILVTLLIVLTPSISKADTVHKVKPKLLYQLKRLKPRVVQQSTVNGSHVYVLQKYFEDSIITEAKKPRHGKKINFSAHKQLILKNFGHTQTWAYAGKKQWFVGCSPKQSENFQFDIELARITFPKHKKIIKNKKSLPRLINLNAASDEPSTSGIRRSEATISPNRKWLLIATVDNDQNGHFAIYDLNQINSALDEASKKADKSVDLKEIKPLDAFHIDHFYGKNYDQLESLQGYAIDNHKNIYISREVKPLTINSTFPREIVKIPWKATDYSNWVHYKINHPSWKKVATELEGLEISGKNINLTVAFHKRNKTHRTFANNIYRIKNIVK